MSNWPGVEVGQPQEGHAELGSRFAAAVAVAVHQGDAGAGQVQAVGGRFAGAAAADDRGFFALGRGAAVLERQHHAFGIGGFRFHTSSW